MSISKPAITLVELLIAITLMAAVALGAVAFEMASRRFLVSSQEDTALLNEMAMILDHVQRNINRATGDATNPGIIWGNNVLRIRIDTNNTPADYSDDGWVMYGFIPANHQITFMPIGASSAHPLTNSLANTPIITTCCTLGTGCVANCLTSPAQGGVRISGLRLSHGDYTVSIEDVTTPPSDTIYFFPFSHSWN